ncbi:MAG TPA: hypothetical protein VK843_09745 [Planctomycetota bacterium]|nr:hypothetical protein [Planctomycetota bacterium]
MKSSRREFLGGLCKTTIGVSVGFALANRLGFAYALPPLALERLRFGALDPLVDLMQATPADALLPIVAAKLKSGTPLADIVAAAALANARGYGGTNYNGYHTLMAMMPSYEMAAQMPAGQTALPVLKVLHRNARLLQETDHATKDELTPLEGGASDAGFVESVHARDLDKSERSLAALQQRSPLQAYEELQSVVRDEMNVHRVVLAWRAYDLLRLTGEDQRFSMLRQSVRFCIDEDGQQASRGRYPNEFRALLPELMEKHGLNARERGNRAADEATIERLAAAFFAQDRAAAADAAAEALAAGIDPEDVGKALSLASARLLLHDGGQTKESLGKPIGSVHGASTGVHASDAANAWKHIARVGSAHNAFASVIAGAYHTAGQSAQVGGLPFDHDAEPCTKSEPAVLLDEVSARIRARDQKGACAAARRYCELGHPAASLFAQLLPFAVSEDGALHAEKFFRTAQEEHASAHARHRALYPVVLARVMASHYGFPAPGVEEARKLLA